jgi:hypothetical protein
MNNFWGGVFGNLHGIAQISSVAAATVGILAASSTTQAIELIIKKRKKKIVQESDANFRISVARFEDNILFSRERVRTTDSAAKLSPPNPSELAKKQFRKRLEEIIEAREREQATAKWLGITSQVLTFGQYIIGATLTTSLAQDTLSKTWISIFGLLVILCSATKQHFHIDENVQKAKARFANLRALVRYTQDQIAILEIKSVNGEDRTDAFISLLNQITHSLNQIESGDTPYMPKGKPELTAQGVEEVS